MIIGLNLPNYGPLGTRDAMTTIAGHAEELGYRSLWTSDQILLPTSEPEPFGHLLETFTSLTWIAAHTTHIRLATGVLVLPQRNPLLVAKQAATLHHLSRGRLTLGVAAGWIEGEFEFLGADFRHRGEVEDEYVTAIRTLFDDPVPRFHGRHVEFDEALFSPRPATPVPIVIGGNGPAALRRAAALGDGWHGLWRSPADVRAAAAALGATARRPFAISVRTRARIGRRLDRDDAGASAATGEAVTALHGTPDQIAARASEFADAGVDELVVEPAASTLEDFLDQSARLASVLIGTGASVSDRPPARERARHH
jgi:probable F420-dependent oxidoreductase